MKKILLLLMLTFFFMTGCTRLGAEKIVIGIDEDFAPISFHDANGELVGFEIDLAKEAASRMGLKPEFKAIDWDNKREEITSGKVDLIWNGLDITDARKEYMIFSKPYMDDRQIVLVKADSTLNFYSADDLKGKIIGTQTGSSSDDYINQDENLRRNIKDYKTYKKFSDAVKALKNDELELILCDELIARYEINAYPGQFKIINVRIGSIYEMGIGFAKNNIALRDRVQKVFDEMIADGTAREISLKWFDADLIKSIK